MSVVCDVVREVGGLVGEWVGGEVERVGVVCGLGWWLQVCGRGWLVLGLAVCLWCCSRRVVEGRADTVNEWSGTPKI